MLLLLALQLALAASPPPRPPAPAALVAAPATALPPAPLPAPEPFRDSPRPLELPQGSSDGLGTVALPAALLLALAGAALLFARRKARGGGFVQVLETASLGPRRALVVARVGDEL